jgi:hypothetical protein
MLKQILGLNRYKVTRWRKLDAASCRYCDEIVLFVASEVVGVCAR